MSARLGLRLIKIVFLWPGTRRVASESREAMFAHAAHPICTPPRITEGALKFVACSARYALGDALIEIAAARLA